MKTAKTQKNDAIFVAISDIHFNLNNLELSSKALTTALKKAQFLCVPLVIAGDLNDTKAIIRAEVANRIIEIVKSFNDSVEIYILVGNHDLVNEKGKEHGLNYLAPYSTIIEDFSQINISGEEVHFIPYQSKSEDLKDILKRIQPSSLIVMHQGVLGAEMGDYVVDKSSIDPSFLAPYTCISGHYHRPQTVGTLSYIGSPFSMSFGESNDGLKGFVVVNRDRTLTRVPLKLRKHIIIECQYSPFTKTILRQGLDISLPDPQDLVWLKIKGPSSVLSPLKKEDFVNFVGHTNFKLDKIQDEKEVKKNFINSKMSGESILDKLIDSCAETTVEKRNLKKLWREVLA